MCGGGGWPEIADGLHSASLPRTAQMNPLGKRGGLPRLLSTVYLFCGWHSGEQLLVERQVVKECHLKSLPFLKLSVQP
jgi:hypothetical protein